MQKAVQTKLIKLSICDCGFSTLNESIKLGTVYTIYPVTIRDRRVYQCGGCHKVYKNVTIVDADQRLYSKHPPIPLPLEIFDYQEEEMA
jgi:hypothetical protein